MEKQLFIFFFWILLIPVVQSQSPYQLKPKKELTIIGTGLGLGTAGFYFHQQMKPLSTMQINALQKKGISKWEVWTTKQGSEKSKNASNILLYTSQTFPVVLTLIDKSMRKDYLKIGTLYSETFLVNIGLTSLVKNSVRRARPFVFDPDLPNEEKITKSARTSFYSGHTSGTASMCFLTARLYADYHPDSKWKPVVWTAAAVVPAAAGILRMRAGKHFSSDVLLGYLTGAAIGYFMPRIHFKKNTITEDYSSFRNTLVLPLK